MFSCTFREIFPNSFFEEQPQATASDLAKTFLYSVYNQKSTGQMKSALCTWSIMTSSELTKWLKGYNP